MYENWISKVTTHVVTRNFKLPLEAERGRNLEDVSCSQKHRKLQFDDNINLSIKNQTCHWQTLASHQANWYIQHLVYLNWTETVTPNVSSLKVWKTETKRQSQFPKKKMSASLHLQVKHNQSFSQEKRGPASANLVNPFVSMLMPVPGQQLQ
jgi:hypothetical protein